MMARNKTSDEDEGTDEKEDRDQSDKEDEIKEFGPPNNV
jgi:hypothetical protein